MTSSGTFTVPPAVTSLRVLCVGGGGSGYGEWYGGGGSGVVSSGNYTVTPGSVHVVTIGAGAVGGSAGTCAAGTTGSSSSFGSLLSCSGGSVSVSRNGGHGGSGGGPACRWTCTGGYGGTNGADGEDVTGSGTGALVGGTGQGSFVPHFTIFKENTFSAGAGGIGVYNPIDAGGSGGGGVLMNGTGPSGGDGGDATWSGKGGKGYGGGGGSGGCDVDACSDCDAGGNGAAGLVYVEWISRMSYWLLVAIHSLHSFSSST